MARRMRQWIPWALLVILFIPIILLARVGTFFYRVSRHNWQEHVVNIRSGRNQSTSESVPAIIHHTWKSSDLSTMPANWQAARQSCRLHNPDFEFRLWTDKDAREFIKDEFGQQALINYDSYPYSIERVDAFRYYLLYRIGGIYMDLDIGCQQSLRPLLRYPALLPETSPAGISNDFMVSRPGHPLFAAIIQALSGSNWRYLLGTKYPTVMFSTGPAFVDLQLLEYFKENDALTRSDGADIKQDINAVYLITGEDYGNGRTSFLYHTKGSSWHGSDAAAILWLGNNGGKLIFLSGVLLIVFGGFWLRRFRSLRLKRDYLRFAA